MSPPVGIPPWEEMHYRLVSLWDIMDRFLLNEIVGAVGRLAATTQVLQDEPRQTAFPKTDYDDLVRDLKIILDCATTNGMLASQASARDALEILKRVQPNQPIVSTDRHLLGSACGATVGRFSDEAKGRYVLVLPSPMIHLYEQAEPLFGVTVDTQFKKLARREIEEAGKCLALDRNTACVFHLMRAIEVALEAVRTCLGIPAPTKGQHKAWGAALDRIREEIEGREKLTWPRQWSSKEDKKLFQQVYASLDAIKDAWRDSTMHVESDYNAREAAHLFALTKGFMQKVASRLDEDGQPLA